MNTVWKIVAVAALVILVVVVVRLIGGDSGSPTTITKLYKVKKGDIERMVFGTGILSSLERAEVKSEIKGSIEKLNVEEGDDVKKGDILAVLKNDEIENEIKVQRGTVEKLRKELEELRKPVDEQPDVISAKLAWEQAESEYDVKKRDLDHEEEGIKEGRPRKLSDEELKRLRDEVDRLRRKMELAEKKYEDSKPTEYMIQEAEGKYEKEQEVLSRLEESADGREVKSPVDGRVMRVLIDKSQLDIDPDREYPEETPFFLVVDLSKAVVEGKVFQSDLGKLEENQPVRIFLNPQSDAFKKGSLTKISLTTSEGSESGRFDIRIEFSTPPRPEEVKIGYRVNFEIIVGEKKDVLVVPVEYVKRKNRQPFVVVREKGKDSERDIRLGVSDDHSYEILDGLEEGDQVVLKIESKE